MSHTELELIERFFAAYAARDFDALRRVLADDATWTFPGHHRLSGTHTGVEAIVTFFDAMGAALGAAGPTVERLVTGVGDGYVIKCQHVQTGRPDGTNLDQRLAVLWRSPEGGSWPVNIWLRIKMRSITSSRPKDSSAAAYVHFK